MKKNVVGRSRRLLKRNETKYSEHIFFIILYLISLLSTTLCFEILSKYICKDTFMLRIVQSSTWSWAKLQNRIWILQRNCIQPNINNNTHKTWTYNHPFKSSHILLSESMAFIIDDKMLGYTILFWKSVICLSLSLCVWESVCVYLYIILFRRTIRTHTHILVYNEIQTCV